MHVKHFKDFMEGEEEEEAFACKALQRFMEEEEEEAFVNSRGAYTLHMSNQPRISPNL